MGFSLEKIIGDTESYAAPDRAFIGAISGIVKNFPWERFENFFESRPLIDGSALDQVFLLRVLAIQEILCLDDEGLLKWLKSQMYLFAFLSPGFKPKVPTKALLNNFRNNLHDANLLEPFRLRCQDVISRQSGRQISEKNVGPSSYLEVFAPSPLDLSESGMIKGIATDTKVEIQFEDKWVICPKCECSALQQLNLGSKSSALKACCEQCGHQFIV